MNSVIDRLPDFWPDRLRHVWFEDFGGVFLTGFLVTLLLPLIVAGCAAVVFGRVPTAFGIANLFWRPSRGGRFVAGLGMGALLWQTVLAGYLFEPLATSYTRDRPPYCDVQPPVGTEKDYTPGLSESSDRNVAARWKQNPELRYNPATIGATFGYLGALARGALVGIPILLLFGGFVLAVLEIITWVYARVWSTVFDRRPNNATASNASPSPSPAPKTAVGSGASQSATDPPERPSASKRVIRWLSQPELPAGVVVGFVCTAGIASALWHAPCLTEEETLYPIVEPCVDSSDPNKNYCISEKKSEVIRADGLAYQVGKRLVHLGRYGEADARQEFNERRITDDYSKLPPKLIQAGLDKYYEAYFDSATPGSTITKLRPYYPVFGAFVIGAVLIVACYLIALLFNVWISKTFTASSGILFLMQVILTANVVLTHFVVTPHLARLGLFFLMLTAAVAYKLRFRNIFKTGGNDYYDAPMELKNYPSNPPELLASTDVEFHTKGSCKWPMAIVCASGGGSRAAAWTMKILTELEQQFKKAQEIDKSLFPPGRAFPHRIRLITGASGGMIAGSYYAAGLTKPGPNGEVTRFGSLNVPTVLTMLNNAVRHDFLTPIARKIAFWDLASIFIPAVFRKDRGTALEESWETHLHGVMGQTFAQLQEGEKQGWRPSLIVTPMTVDDGRQLFISNLDLRAVAQNRANILRGANEVKNGYVPKPDGDLLSREGWGFFRLFPDAHKTFQVGTAARMSASFPFVLPAVELPTTPPLRVVDAGYYDNFGVGVAAEWLFENDNMKWVRENCSGVVVIQIRDGVSEAERRDQTQGFAQNPGPGRLGRGLQWLTSPVEGLYSFRAQATAYRNDNLLAMLSERFNRRVPKNPDGSLKDPASAFFQTVAFEFAAGGDVSLNFTLTEEEKALIDLAADPTCTLPFPTATSVMDAAAVRNSAQVVQDRITALINWWRGRSCIPESTPPQLPGGTVTEMSPGDGSQGKPPHAPGCPALSADAPAPGSAGQVAATDPSESKRDSGGTGVEPREGAG